MMPAKTDPKVSCPIVCGEYMRATGFFFKNHSQMYLITARHNLLPTNAANLATGDHQLTYQTNDFLPTIDIYLDDGATFTVKRVNILEKQNILLDTDIDIIGIPIDIDPETYGYIPWRFTEIASPDTTFTTLDVIGYPNQAYPDENEYDAETYAEEIIGPYVLNLSNDSPTPTQTGYLDIGIDTGPKRTDTDYEGYSGCPILGDGLVGIHCANLPVTTVNTDTNDRSEHTAIAYWRADSLKRLFNIEHLS